MKERIQKILANAGVASRRNVEQMVRDGRVTVNGKTLSELPILIDPERDKIEVDGDRVKLGLPKTDKRYYFILNKPKGIYCTNASQGAQVRAIDLMPRDLPCRLYPVGRLDAESKGLLLLTNDGDLTNQLTHPRYGVAKTYRAVVDGNVDSAELGQLEAGIWLADKEGQGFKTGRSHLRVVHHGRTKSTLEITIREGRNREVRRMLAKLGHKVRDLIRIRMGPLDLHGLAPGEFRPLTGKEVRLLHELGKPRK
jgi:23S rRNA pseudouridine2605 synthase